MAEIVRMRSFASPAARVLRSVRSRWQTRLAQRTRACNDHSLNDHSLNEHPLSNLYHDRMGLSSASRFRDSNQPDAAPCRRDGRGSWQPFGRGSSDSFCQPDADRRRGYDPGGATGEGRVHLPPAGRGGDSLSHVHPARGSSHLQHGYGRQRTGGARRAGRRFLRRACRGQSRHLQCPHGHGNLLQRDRNGGIAAAQIPLRAYDFQSVCLHRKNCREAWARPLSGAAGHGHHLRTAASEVAIQRKTHFGGCGQHRQDLQQRFSPAGHAGVLFSVCEVPGAERAAEWAVDPNVWQFLHQGIYCRRFGVLGVQSQHGRHGGRRLLFETRLVRTRTISCSSERHFLPLLQLRGNGGSRYRHSSTESGRRGREVSCRAAFWDFPRRRQCRLLEFIRVPHRLHRCVHPGDRLRSEVADFSLQYHQRISLQRPGGALPELRSLYSGTGNEHGLQCDYADGAGPDSAHAKFLSLRRGAAVGKYAALLVVRERGRGFAAARDWVSHRSSGGQVRPGALAGHACAMAGMVVPSRPYVAGYVLYGTGQPGRFRNRNPGSSESQIPGGFVRVASAVIVADLRSSLARTQMEARD